MSELRYAIRNYGDVYLCVLDEGEPGENVKRYKVNRAQMLNIMEVFIGALRCDSHAAQENYEDAKPQALRRGGLC